MVGAPVPARSERTGADTSELERVRPVGYEWPLCGGSGKLGNSCRPAVGRVIGGNGRLTAMRNLDWPSLLCPVERGNGSSNERVGVLAEEAPLPDGLRDPFASETGSEKCGLKIFMTHVLLQVGVTDGYIVCASARSALSHSFLRAAGRTTSTPRPLRRGGRPGSLRLARARLLIPVNLDDLRYRQTLVRLLSSQGAQILQALQRTAVVDDEVDEVVRALRATALGRQACCACVVRALANRCCSSRAQTPGRPPG